MQAQMRRSMITITADKRGRKQVRIRGNVKRKTMQGRSDNYAPLNKMIYGEFEVIYSKYFLVLMVYSDVPIHHRITPASISTYHASTYFLVFMFYSDVPIHCRITPTSISTYHAIKIFSCFHVLFRCASSSPNYSCQHFHISCIQIFSCSHVLFRCANSSPNYSCQHFHISCIKIFSCFHVLF